MTSTRRTFLKKSTTLAAASAATIIPYPLFAQLGAKPEPVPPIEDPRIKELVQTALDSSRASGASYADVRLTHQKTRNYVEQFGGSKLWASSDTESMTVGVRALVNGYWGFSAGPIWSVDEMARLGRASANLARANALGKSRRVNMAPVSIIQNGHWITPIKINPFEVPREEIFDYFSANSKFLDRLRGLKPPPFGNVHQFTVTDKAFGSTEGSYATQRLFLSGARAFWMYKSVYGDLSEHFSLRGEGWEMYREQPFNEYIRVLYEELKEDASYPAKPVDVGRYDVIFDTNIVAGLVASSIGAATQLDRALGYEANATGTSYITDPQAMLGTFKVGSPLLTVSANRTSPGAAATVRWDDEGVEPDVFTLVQDGLLSDYQTTRESAGWKMDWDAITPQPFRSHGCAAAPEGVDAPLAHTPNLQMTPAQDQTDLASLVASLEKGLLIKGGNVTMDFQQLNGYGSGLTWEVKNGKRVAFLLGAGMLLRAPEFWKSLQAIGGERSVKRHALQSEKGEPNQKVWHSVDAVPVCVKDMTIIDKLRKA